MADNFNECDASATDVVARADAIQALGDAAAAQVDATQALADAALRGTMAIIPATRDLSLASANVAYTGFGGTPKKLRMYLTSPNVGSAVYLGSVGESNGTVQMFDRGAWDNTSGRPFQGQSTAEFGLSGTTSGNYQTASVVSFDADGVTLSWTKVGLPAGTAQIKFIVEF